MRRGLALAFAACGLLVAGLTMAGVAITLQANQPAGVWPFPGLYLIEVVALSSAIVLAVLTERPRALLIAWAAIGALFTLTVLGALTIGPFIGAALIALVPALLLGRTASRSHAIAAGAIAAGAVIQAGAMFAAIRLMIR